MAAIVENDWVISYEIRSLIMLVTELLLVLPLYAIHM